MTIDGIATAALQRSLAEAGNAAQGVARATVATTDAYDFDTPDLTAELLRLLRSQRQVEVAVEVARTADETTESTLKLVR